jgi:hypothetical protein
VGVVVDEVHPKVIAEAIERAIASEDYPVWVSNCAQAARVLNWESDFQKIRVALATL